jgi:hypothetical protein
MRTVLGFLLGAVGLGAISFGLGLLYLTYGGVSQAEGAAAMGVIFFWVPVGTVLGGIIGAVIGHRWGR